MVACKYLGVVAAGELRIGQVVVAAARPLFCGRIFFFSTSPAGFVGCALDETGAVSLAGFVWPALARTASFAFELP